VLMEPKASEVEIEEDVEVLSRKDIFRILVGSVTNRVLKERHREKLPKGLPNVRAIYIRYIKKMFMVVLKKGTKRVSRFKALNALLNY
jgi:hypothetical protein